MYKFKPILIPVVLLSAVIGIQGCYFFLLFPALSFESQDLSALINLLVVDISFLIGIVLGFIIWDSSIFNKWNIPDSKTIALVFLIAIVVFIIYPAGNPFYFINSLMDHKLDFFEFREPSFHTKSQIYFYIKGIVIGPILEELFYRKMILSKLMENHTAVFSIFISSILFSLGHLDFQNFIQLFFIGLIYGFVYYKSNSVLSSILLHSLVNFLIGFTANVVVNLDDANYSYLIIFIICFMVLFWALKKMNPSKTTIQIR